MYVVKKQLHIFLFVLFDPLAHEIALSTDRKAPSTQFMYVYYKHTINKLSQRETRMLKSNNTNGKYQIETITINANYINCAMESSHLSQESNNGTETESEKMGNFIRWPLGNMCSISFYRTNFSALRVLFLRCTIFFSYYRVMHIKFGL